MPLTSPRAMFERAYKEGYAIGAFNVNNMEIIQGIMEAGTEKKNKVYHNGDIKSMSLADLYGKMAIEAQIIKMDVYHLPFLKISDFELFYNYLGSIEMK